MITLTKEAIQNNVAANFSYVRKQFGISMREMGERLGLPQKTYAAIEEGRASSAHHVYRLSMYTGISMHTLFTTELNNQ